MLKVEFSQRNNKIFFFSMNSKFDFEICWWLFSWNINLFVNYEVLTNNIQDFDAAWFLNFLVNKSNFDLGYLFT